SGVTVRTSRDMKSPIGVSGSRPSASARTTMSRSVMMPASVALGHEDRAGVALAHLAGHLGDGRARIDGDGVMGHDLVDGLRHRVSLRRLLLTSRATPASG